MPLSTNQTVKSIIRLAVLWIFDASHKPPRSMILLKVWVRHQISTKLPISYFLYKLVWSETPDGHIITNPETINITISNFILNLTYSPDIPLWDPTSLKLCLQPVRLCAALIQTVIPRILASLFTESSQLFLCLPVSGVTFRKWRRHCIISVNGRYCGSTMLVWQTAFIYFM